MNAATVTYRTMPDPPSQMSGAVFASLVFHGLVVLFMVTGLPFFKSEPVDITATPMAVELISSDELENVSNLKKPVSEKAEAPPKPPMPQMPTVTAKTPPKPVAPEKPEIVEEVVAPPPIKEENTVEKAKPDPKPVTPPTPAKRPALTSPKPEVEENPEEFQGLLRNLMESQPQISAEKPVDKQPPAKESPLDRFSQQLTSSEFSALRQQLSQCWSVLAGARQADQLQVQIRLTVNRDRTIRSASIVDQLRYSRDSYFQAAADEALRAVRNPGCNPLELPPDKYEQWKSIVITFDPSQLL